MPDVVAALGCSQIEKVEELIQSRRKIAETYDKGLDDTSGVVPVWGRDTGGDRNVYQLYSVLCDSESVRSSVVSELKGRDIASKIYWDPPVHRTKAYDGTACTYLPDTEDVASRVLSLPMYPSLSDKSIYRVIEGIKAGIKSA
jgi:perosamine synthetase